MNHYDFTVQFYGWNLGISLKIGLNFLLTFVNTDNITNCKIDKNTSASFQNHTDWPPFYLLIQIALQQVCRFCLYVDYKIIKKVSENCECGKVGCVSE